MNKKKVIYVHGFGGPKENNWEDWLALKFRVSGFDFIKLSMPSPMYPEVGEWLAYLNAQNIEVDEDTYFIGHSLGCITIARYLEALPSTAVAGGCIFIAGFCSLPKIPLLESFCSLPLDFSEVKKHAEEFIIILSDDDHYVPRASSEELGAKLDAKIITEHKKGHFEEDVKMLPSVLNTILVMDELRENVRYILK
jgi:predicted alpha/beta hydrolase family esterase